MISFSRLGLHSRLGNHLFQYAFLRTAARRLGVKFYCPPWAGDSFFNLDDQAEREPSALGISRQYHEREDRPGMNAAALKIADGTDVQGYFQSEQYFDRSSVLDWYRFKPEKIASIKKRYAHVSFSNSVGLSVRLGDFLDPRLEKKFYVARRFYYLKALKRLPDREHVVVFSDDIAKARMLLGDLGPGAVFVENYEPYEGLYLQAQCHDFIGSTSTYSWWGAWLNRYPDRLIVAPAEGPFRPGARLSARPFRPGLRLKNDDFWPRQWTKLRALHPGIDHYQFVKHRRPLFGGV